MGLELLLPLVVRPAQPVADRAGLGAGGEGEDGHRHGDGRGERFGHVHRKKRPVTAVHWSTKPFGLWITCAQVVGNVWISAGRLGTAGPRYGRAGFSGVSRPRLNPSATAAARSVTPSLA